MAERDRLAGGRRRRPAAVGWRSAAVLSVAALAGLAAAGDRGTDDGSDPEALRLADAVLERMGGRSAWEETRYLAWSFFGARAHVWDKHTGTIRVEGTTRETGEPYVVIMNLDSGEGRVWRGGAEVTEPEPRREMLHAAEGAWINDSYWLVMPYKLRDPGVTLRHRGERKLADGRTADVLELTFEEVGRTPENRYDVYVARDTGLVERWDFYRRRTDTEPALSTPWRGWKRYGRIMLCGDRGERQLGDIRVPGTIPEHVFTSPDPVVWP